MFRRNLLLVLGLLMLTGSLAGFAAAKRDCLPCTAWCKKHPNADRCT